MLAGLVDRLELASARPGHCGRYSITATCIPGRCQVRILFSAGMAARRILLHPRHPKLQGPDSVAPQRRPTAAAARFLRVDVSRAW